MKLQEFVWIDNVGSGFSGVTEKCFRFSLKKVVVENLEYKNIIIYCL
ncbi:hypothetical protein LEP1GSC111_1462 [Leptospira interrogans str. UT126]|nr:hypothetical protein LEP1GSC111_1462 [Leptospira interrogans str. UT126]